MKYKLIDRPTVHILIVDLPEGAKGVLIDGVRHLTKTMICLWSDKDLLPAWKDIDIPPGNWQPLTFDEETAQRLFRFEYHTCSPHIKCWEDVTEPGAFPPFDRAMESLQSLIDSEVLRENPIPKDIDYDDRLCEYCSLEKKGVYGVNGGYVAGCEGSRCDEARDNHQQKYQEAEANVFKNPFYFYQLKNNG